MINMTNTELLSEIKDSLNYLEEDYDLLEEAYLNVLMDKVTNVSTLTEEQAEFYWSVTPRLSRLRAQAEEDGIA